MTAANLPYQQKIPDGTKQFRIFTRHPTAIFRLSWQFGAVNNAARPEWWEIKNGVEYYIENVNTSDLILHMQTDTANAGLALEYWS